MLVLGKGNRGVRRWMVGVTVSRCCMDNCLIEVPVARETVVPVYIYPYDALFDHSPAAPLL
jgi:hypothetical protein